MFSDAATLDVSCKSTCSWNVHMYVRVLYTIVHCLLVGNKYYIHIPPLHNTPHIFGRRLKEGRGRACLQTAG